MIDFLSLYLNQAPRFVLIELQMMRSIGIVFGGAK